MQTIEQQLENGSRRFEKETPCLLGDDDSLEFVIDFSLLSCAAAYAAQFPNNFFERRGIKCQMAARERIEHEPNIVYEWLLDSNAATELLLAIVQSSHSSHPALETMLEGVRRRNDDDTPQQELRHDDDSILVIYY